FAGLRDDGYVLINTTKTLAELGIEETTSKLPAGHVATVGATELAMKHLKRPTPNTVLLGAFTAMSDTVQIDSVCAAILKKFPGKIGEMNVEAARAAHAAAAAA
ncbi:MAG: 2-oxoacid:acceptor oxidoreductase, partial [Gammaproteobacteria bacterium]|nr:2-oxoacid:acceptor oxidoreductase [Gammaproteobacteria bacterium]